MTEQLLSFVDRHYIAIIIGLMALIFFGPAITNGLVKLFTRLGWLRAAAWIAAKGPGFIGKLQDLEDAIVRRETEQGHADMLETHAAELEALASVTDDPRVVELAVKHRANVGGAPTKSLPPIA